jgi:mannose-1-phosphate guanylyltransferase
LATRQSANETREGISRAWLIADHLNRLPEAGAILTQLYDTVVIGTKKVGMKGKHLTPPIWAIVLAGGDGIRLQDLTCKIHGDVRPKQFSTIVGDQSLLGHTRERLNPIFGDDRLLFVVTKDHDIFYTEELADIDSSRVVTQPANRGTGVAIIAALLQLLEHEVEAIVGIFPSDHYHADNAAFAANVKLAIDISNEHVDSVVLIGAKPEWPEVEFGWIKPGVSITNGTRTPLFAVSRFCEKPPLNEARNLMKNGGLWNTFVTIGRASAFLKLLRATVSPALTSIAEAVASGDLNSVYNEIETIDFSKHVLTREAGRLLVMADNTSGWADLGNEARVIDTLERNKIEPAWLREIRRSRVPAELNVQVPLRCETALVTMRNTVTV